MVPDIPVDLHFYFSLNRFCKTIYIPCLPFYTHVYFSIKSSFTKTYIY